jgi:hypothetical protein
MKTIFMTVAAVSALAVAGPAMAQPWNGTWNANGASGAEFQSRIDRGIRNGAISPREATPLRSSLRQLTSLERRYARNGLTNRERNTLRQRGAMLNRQLVSAERSGSTRAAMDSRFDHPNRGDRFAGDIRVGQRPSARMIALPDRYRTDYRDSDAVYYRYDNDRIYEVDRATNLVMGLMDLPN